MYSGFPTSLLPVICCPWDQAPLEPVSTGKGGDPGFLRVGALQCAECKRTYSITDGILVLSGAEDVQGESRKEQAIRDEAIRLAPQRPSFAAVDEHDLLEMRPTMAALAATPGLFLLEFGCGTGRYTLRLAARGVTMIAMDFSRESLRVLAQRLPAGVPVGLVQGDVTRRCVSRRCCDRILSTLVSNLPTKEHRLTMLRVASEALKDEGLFVYSTHHHDLVNRMLGGPQAGRYPDCGIYRYLMREHEIHREAAVYFRETACRPIRVTIPFADRTRIPAALISSVAERLPILRQKGDLLLATTCRPIREPSEGQGSRPTPILGRLLSVLKDFQKRRSDKSPGGPTTGPRPVP